MSEKKTEAHTPQQCYRCEFDPYHYSCGTTFCVREGLVEVDGLMLCERHALEAKLEGQIECWGAILAHIDLWSREATRRERPEIRELLEVERLKAEAATERACRELELARSRTPISSSGYS
jgi:hypothetical protein